VYLQVSSEGFGYIKVAGAVQEMLARNLGVRVATTVLPTDQHFERVEFSKAQLWREGWIVDHPDPENFLALLYGASVPADTSAPSYLNSTRYSNQAYDRLFAQALRTSNRSERMAFLARAERLAMEDMPVTPLYHERLVRLLQPWVRDLPLNGMDHTDLRGVWFDPAQRGER
jgi:peptide/nickel transport system substrate-binding protein